MKDQNNIKNELLSKSNIFLVIATYLIVSIPLSLLVFSAKNLAVPDLPLKIIHFLVVLFVAAPGFAIGVLGLRIRFTHFQKTKDFSEFLLPAKGSLGNPDINVFIGPKGKKLLDIFLRILLILVIFTLIVLPLWKALI